MKKIIVKTISSQESISSQYGDYECNHAGARVEEVETGHPDDRLGDWVSTTHDVLVCDKCDAWYNEIDECWDS